MKKLIGVILIVVVVIIAVVLTTNKPPSPNSGSSSQPNPIDVKPAQPTLIRMVYPGNSLITSHMGETLNHTNILEKNRLIGEFSRLETDTQIIASLNTQRFDAVVLSDLACTLALAQDFNGIILANLGALGRNALMVPPDSTIKVIKDLGNSAIGVTLGSPAHYHLLTWLKREALEPGKNVTLVNLSQTELYPAILQGTIRAIALSDPWVQQLTREHNFENRADALS